jgi:hypothetical protein
VTETSMVIGDSTFLISAFGECVTGGASAACEAFVKELGKGRTRSRVGPSHPQRTVPTLANCTEDAVPGR